MNDRTSETPAEVGTKMAHGAGWMLLARFGVRGIGLISTIILARLLMPDDFGIVALASVIIAGMEAISEFSFNVFLIAKQDSDRQHYDTIWTLSIFRGLVTAVILFAAAPLFTGFFDDARIVPVVQWIAVTNIVTGLTNPGIVDFQKELKFFRDLVWTMGSKMASFTVTVILAVLWQNYWALVAGIITSSVSQLALSYLMHPFRPRLSLKKIREVVGFSGWMLATNVILFVRNRSDQLIVAKLLDAATLGVYSMALEIASMVSIEILAPIRRVFLPGYSQIANDLPKITKVYLDTFALLTMLMAPLPIGLGLVAAPLVRVFLGHQWLDCIPLLEIFSVFAMCNIWSTTGSSILLAMKRPAAVTLICLVTTALFVPFMAWSAARSGAIGMASMVTYMAAGIMLMEWMVVCRLLPITLKDIVLRIWRCLTALAAMAGAVLIVRESLPVANTFAADLVGLMVLVGTGAVTYVTVLAALWHLGGRAEGPERLAFQFIRDKWPMNRRLAEPS